MTLNNWGFVGDFKVNEVSSQHLDLPLGAVAVGIVMRQDRYDTLPPPARAAIDQFSGEALARKLGEAFDRQEKEVRERVSRSGRNSVVAPSSAELAEWRRVIEPVNESWRKAKPRNERTHAAFVEQLQRMRSAG
jgi:TRAP-type C4-dicarboxylate transport system substrate-binding protein